jgi:hypothetical protein
VRHEIEREVERGYPENRPDRKSPEDAEMGIGPWGPVEWNDLAGDPLRFFCCNSEGLNGSIDFSFGVRDRFPRLGGHETGKFFPPIGERPGDLLEETVACVRRQRRHGRCGVDG